MLIEGFAPDSIAAHAGSSLQARGLAHSVQDGSPPAEHTKASCTFDFLYLPESENASGCGTGHVFRSRNPAWRVRELRKENLGGLAERVAELEGMRRRELLGVNSRWRPLASEVHLPILRGKLLELGIGFPFISGFPFRGPVSVGSVYPLKQESPPPIPQSQLFGGARERRSTRMSSRKSHYGLKPWAGAPIQVAMGWLGVPG